MVHPVEVAGIACTVGYVIVAEFVVVVFESESLEVRYSAVEERPEQPEESESVDGTKPKHESHPPKLLSHPCGILDGRASIVGAPSLPSRAHAPMQLVLLAAASV